MDSVLTGAEVAALLKINIKSVRKHLNGRKVGRRVLYSAAEIRKIMGELSTAPQKKPPMFDEVTTFNVENVLEGRSLGFTQRLWQEALPGGHDPRDFLGEMTFCCPEGRLFSMAMTCVETIEGGGKDRKFTYKCPYCYEVHKQKYNLVPGGHCVAPCGLGVTYCTNPELSN